MTEPSHVPVLLDEVLEALNPQPGGTFIDATVGQGGHARAILSRVTPDGRLLGIDRDESNLAIAQKRLIQFGEAAVLVHDSYANVTSHAYDHGFSGVDGILLDLGFSSAHIEEADRGFSFQNEGPLDMRYDRSSELTAAEIVNTWSEDELAACFRKWGEEPRARDIAKAIIAHRPVETTTELAELIRSVVKTHGRTHPATRVFQAIRMAVNNELGELEVALPKMVDLLKPGGRLAIISFHSLEDRQVKQFLKSNDQLALINKRVIVPTQTEIKTNPRARSAKLRVAAKR